MSEQALPNDIQSTPNIKKIMNELGKPIKSSLEFQLVFDEKTISFNFSLN